MFPWETQASTLFPDGHLSLETPGNEQISIPVSPFPEASQFLMIFPFPQIKSPDEGAFLKTMPSMIQWSARRIIAGSLAPIKDPSTMAFPGCSARKTTGLEEVPLTDSGI